MQCNEAVRLGARLRRIRNKRAQTTYAVAEALGCDQSTVVRMERGEIGAAALDRIGKYAAIYGYRITVVKDPSVAAPRQESGVSSP